MTKGTPMPRTYKFMDAEHTIVGRDDGRSFAWPKHIDNVANLNGRIAEEYRLEGSPKISPYTESKPVAATKPKQQAKPPADPVAAAEQTVAQLQEKREKQLAERSRIEGEMGQHSFAAHARSDMRAVEALDQIATDISRLDARVREIDLAIATANRALLDARQAERQAADRQKAEEALTLLHETGKCFEYLDRHLNEAVRALIAIDNGFAQLRQSGFVISDTADRIGITAIIQSWAHRIPRRWHEQLRDNFEFLAPGARRTATEHWTRMRASIDGQITKRLGEADEQPNKERAA
jgi:hypothetical protein